MAGRDVEDTAVEIGRKSLPDIAIALDLFRKRNRRGFENPGQDMNWRLGRIHYLSRDAVSVRSGAVTAMSTSSSLLKKPWLWLI